MKLEMVTTNTAIDGLAARAYDEDGRYVPFWYTQTGYILKWCLFGGFIGIVALYLIVGHIHANRRMRKGLMPLGYHRWLVPRAQLARVDPRYAYPQPTVYPVYQPPNAGYGMYAMPPPVYDPNTPRPPMYEGAKVDPDQSTRQPAEQQAGVYEPPPGPPPGAMRQ